MFKAIYHRLEKLYNLLSCKISLQGKNNRLINLGYLKQVKIIIHGHNNQLVIGSNSRLSNMLIYIYGNNNSIDIGSKCIYRGGHLYVEDSGCRVIIGKSTSIESATISCTEGGKISIGSYCMLAHEIDIRNGDSHPITDRITHKRLNLAKDIIIDNHVWLGNKVTVLKGVFIGSGTVIGAASVITHRLSPNCVYAGNPARLVHRSITWDKSRH